MRGTSGSRRSRQQHGAAAVEFALVVPILLMLFFAIVQFSLYFWSAQTGTSVANAAVRRLAVGDCQDLGQLTTFVTNKLGPTNKGGLTVSRTYTDNNTPPNVLPAPAPPASPLPMTAVGGTVSLTISFQSLNMHFPIPFLNLTTVSRTVDARIEDNSQDSSCS